MTDTANRAQLDSPSYILPVFDSEFLLRDEMRGVRFQLEYAKADLALRDWGVRSTRARDVTISATYSPAPCSRHRRRNARFVTPAIGASTTGVWTSIGPMRRGGSTAPGAMGAWAAVSG